MALRSARSSRRRTTQLALDLQSSSSWGGRRVGAGRKRGAIPQVSHTRRAPLAGRHPCHITIKVRSDVPSLRSARLVRELESSWRQVRDRGRFRIAHYSIQSNHVHLLVEASSAADVGSGMKSVSARLARAVNRVFSRSGAVLRERYHLHVLRSPREVRNALAYVLLNARRHAVALGSRFRSLAHVDPGSSGRWFDGWRSVVEPAHDPPAIAQPHTWLLRVGWRRAGLIDPSEIPGRRGTTRLALHDGGP